MTALEISYLTSQLAVAYSEPGVDFEAMASELTYDVQIVATLTWKDPGSKGHFIEKVTRLIPLSVNEEVAIYHIKEIFILLVKHSTEHNSTLRRDAKKRGVIL